MTPAPAHVAPREVERYVFTTFEFESSKASMVWAPVASISTRDFPIPNPFAESIQSVAAGVFQVDPEVDEYAI